MLHASCVNSLRSFNLSMTMFCDHTRSRILKLFHDAKNKQSWNVVAGLKFFFFSNPQTFYFHKVKLIHEHEIFKSQNFAYVNASRRQGNVVLPFVLEGFLLLSNHEMTCLSKSKESVRNKIFRSNPTKTGSEILHSYPDLKVSNFELDFSL